MPAHLTAAPVNGHQPLPSVPAGMAPSVSARSAAAAANAAVAAAAVAASSHPRSRQLSQPGPLKSGLTSPRSLPPGRGVGRESGGVSGQPPSQMSPGSNSGSSKSPAPKKFRPSFTRPSNKNSRYVPKPMPQELANLKTYSKSKTIWSLQKHALPLPPYYAPSQYYLLRPVSSCGLSFHKTYYTQILSCSTGFKKFLYEFKTALQRSHRGYGFIYNW